ncbi:DUF6170 family protein [Gayadomonas joobiniege]|uniref:DUF6170 family protein n=1 Tax=Gayadomonas joobiniege TaxID=1234606 RepID=UPI00035E415A|nr:DUF6170 family protein [Gayadomonas joobiniege]
MPFYLKSSQIPALKDYSFTERAHIIQYALNMLTVPEKFILNISKLIILAPVFVLIARFQEWWMLIPMLITGICYPLITNPIQLNMACRHLDQALASWKADQSH